MSTFVRDLILLEDAPQFDPIGLGNLQLWLDAADASSITLDGSDKVSEWADKSGLANHFSQATDTLRPSIGTVNGLDGVSFDAVDDLLTGPTLFASNTAFTLFAVARMDALATGATAYFTLGTDKFFGLALAAALSNRPGYLNGSIAWRSEASGGLTPGDVCIQQLSRTGSASSYLRYPGAVTVSNTESPFAAPYGVARIGWQGGAGANRHATTVCEVILYTADITAGEKTSVRAYLGAKWGVTV